MKLVLIPLLVLFIGAAWVRFLVLEDYLISYEVDCTEPGLSCFIGCEDDDCQTVYNYYYVEKKASDLVRECGESIIDCPGATTCLTDDQQCEVTMCTESALTNCVVKTDDETSASL